MLAGLLGLGLKCWGWVRGGLALEVCVGVFFACTGLFDHGVVVGGLGFGEGHIETAFRLLRHGERIEIPVWGIGSCLCFILGRILANDTATGQGHGSVYPVLKHFYNTRVSSILSLFSLLGAVGFEGLGAVGFEELGAVALEEVRQDCPQLLQMPYLVLAGRRLGRRDIVLDEMRHRPPEPLRGLAVLIRVIWTPS